MQWYRDRGLTKQVTRIVQTDYHPTLKPGDEWEVEEITMQHSAGRIDVYGVGEHGPEISVPPMLSEDWYRFSEWLREFNTEAVWTLDQLVEQYERDNPAITWANE